MIVHLNANEVGYRTTSLPNLCWCPFSCSTNCQWIRLAQCNWFSFIIYRLVFTTTLKKRKREERKEEKKRTNNDDRNSLQVASEFIGSYNCNKNPVHFIHCSRIVTAIAKWEEENGNNLLFEKKQTVIKVVWITLHYSFQRATNMWTTAVMVNTYEFILSRDKDHFFHFAMFPIIVIKMLCQIYIRIQTHFVDIGISNVRNWIEYWMKTCNFCAVSIG